DFHVTGVQTCALPILVEFIRTSALSSKSPGVPPRQIRKVFGFTTCSGVLSPTITPSSTRQNAGSPSHVSNVAPPPLPPRPPMGADRKSVVQGTRVSPE